ncbi:AMP-binding protein [Lichenicoccus sp.]|uniref:AMP-binding protein n=1 Tax=Lichenicoccus sp. TaxID=2781899 RepID=UPI003D140D38
MPPPALGPIPGVISGGRRRSTNAMRERALRAAEGLRRLGIVEGDTVALLVGRDFPLFEASIAAVSVGAYPMPLNWHGMADEMGYILRDSAAKVLVVHGDLLPGVAAGLPEGLTVIVVEMPVEIAMAYRLSDRTPCVAATLDWVARHAALRNATDAFRASVIYTSGTTGRPKGRRSSTWRGGRRVRPQHRHSRCHLYRSGRGARGGKRRPIRDRRRHRLYRRGGLPVPKRPPKGHDYFRRGEHLPGRDRGTRGQTEPVQGAPRDRARGKPAARGVRQDLQAHTPRALWAAIGRGI